MLGRFLQENAFMSFHKQTLIHKKEIAKVSRKSILLCFIIEKAIRPSLLYMRPSADVVHTSKI